MYTPISNIVINAAMRWPSLGLAIFTIGGLLSDNIFGQVVAWFASVAFATFIATKTFGDELRECDEKAIKKGLALIPAVTWFVEYSPETGEKRPWDLYSMFGDDESTKVHYASYATEKAAMLKKALLEGDDSKEEDKP